MILQSHCEDTHVALPPSAAPSSKPTVLPDSRSVVSPQGKGSPVSGTKKIVMDTPPSVSYQSTPGKNGSGDVGGSSGTWLSSLLCTPPPPPALVSGREMTEMTPNPPHTSRQGSARKAAPPQGPASIFTDVSNYVWKITSDPDFQFAGLI